MKTQTLKIGKIKINPPLILAPMVDVTDLPYRLICRKAGATLAYTEMLYVDAITHENKKTLKLMQTTDKEKPLGIQITGNNLESFQKAIPYLKKYDLVDLNCGCPSERIIGSKSGSFLLNNPELIYKIIKLLKSHNLTVTAKIRLGFKKYNLLEIAKSVEKAGADAITLHPRLASHGYDTKADIKEIKKLKSIVKIPVIGNGDVFSGKQAKEILELCDGVMIARGAIGDPLIFSRVNEYLKNGKEVRFDIKENINYLKEYLGLCEKYKFNELQRIKRISAKFIKNFPGATKIRNQMMLCNSIHEIEKIISNVELSK